MADATLKVAIVGAGRLGTAVAHTMRHAAQSVTLWSRRYDQARAVAESIETGVRAEPSLTAAVGQADLTVLAVPVAALRGVAREMSRVLQGDHVILHAIRGVEPGFVLPGAILREETCVRRIGVLGGPIYAPQLAGNKAMAAVLATRFAEPWEMAVALTRGSPLRLHRTADIVGVQVAGAMSNAAALAVGVAEGLALGDTARGLFSTRGLMEAAVMAALCGGEASTLIGLAGVGDLIPRHVATASRHIEAGQRCVSGKKLDDAARLQVDGLVTADAALELARQHNRTLPLMQAVRDIFCGQQTPQRACETLLALDFNPSEALTSRAFA